MQRLEEYRFCPLDVRLYKALKEKRWFIKIFKNKNNGE